MSPDRAPGSVEPCRDFRPVGCSQASSKLYPTVDCALEHRNAFELLVATVLSAQCTDARVNR